MNLLKSISDFYVAGINYRKTDAAIRGDFAINHDQYDSLLSIASHLHLNELFVLSTCNRTEIYGIAPSVDELITLLCSQAAGDEATFRSLAYVKRGKEAIEHLFNVAAGLDSQILGDYEIVGQIRKAVNFSKERGNTGIFMERLLSSILQSARSIRTATELSSGTVSVSYAAVQYIREYVADIASKKILLLGIGKIGRNTCKNLVDYLGAEHITLINRTNEKAQELADDLGLQYAPYDTLEKQLQEADIILVATNATRPTVIKSQLESPKRKMVIDLSIPYNVDSSAAELPNVKLLHIDDLSKVNDITLKKREAEIPKAKAIIAGHIASFRDWYMMRKNVPVIKAVKDKLEYLQSCSMCGADNNMQDEEKIQKVLNAMASKMRSRNEGGCNYIEAINDFMNRS